MPILTLLSFALAAPATATVTTAETLVYVQTAIESEFLPGYGVDSARTLVNGDTAVRAESSADINSGLYAGYYGDGFGYALANSFFKVLVDGAPGSLWHVAVGFAAQSSRDRNATSSLFYQLEHFNAADELLSRRSFYTALCSGCANEEYFETSDLWQLDATAGDQLVLQYQAVVGQATSGGGFGYANNYISSSLSVTAASVPEPATWAMLIAGFGMAGAAMRRRRNVPA
ncbi:PEP-CTERM sorting domain-containing protein [Glacieibacterium frigidum]|uniref:PEP-CTERM sorting domain-containing protein n=2 Tax=Glacieibacterium frigidum TaxID=2593303 RepID=A0A552UJM5_9SPHN|nr:PEP-CTERM sorting domain-containing protein [Glacieibacterium frigidum]